MRNRGFNLLAGAGCALLFVLIIAAACGIVFFIPIETVLAPDEDLDVGTVLEKDEIITPAADVAEVRATQVAIPTLTTNRGATAENVAEGTGEQLDIEVSPALQVDAGDLIALYEQLTPGVVSIRIFSEQAFAGEGAGSGFVLDENGYIVTNDHVVAGTAQVTVAFYNGEERAAEVIGTDDDSDLAVLRVEELPDGVRPLPIGDSDELRAGQPVIAIGNPFGFGGSMSLGIVSAVGRVIPGLASAGGGSLFSIPQAIQTDAAINPGNSGGPLLNMQGQVVGVNAQIFTTGVAANSGVGFAIPANVVRLVAPVLIAEGRYQWPYLGVSGQPVDLAVQRANELETQNGAYIHNVVPGTPADQAGLRGSTGTEAVLGRRAPVGGDIVLSFNGRELEDFNDLLALVAFSNPGDEVVLTVLRDGEVFDVTVELAARPQTVEEEGP